MDFLITYNIWCRVRWALQGTLEKGASLDLQDQQVYQASTCGGTPQRNGLPFRSDGNHNV